MINVRWSKSSIEDLKSIYEFIALDSPQYALLFKDRIFEIIEHLETFPNMGRQVPESDDPDVRELFYKNYRIIYQIKKGYLEIIIVIYGSRLLKL
ncbi:MAG: type II toxin-antitoxin system RelE/ParE family toxin [Candidatus Altiarchaeales archaeon HGW-Altiarchaeales-2]|nr:MAG: type II toxin-antitoxin system RelE/ParE family toxin [Candidatus Altiarchaeales archaeon HGW-Altiarchaeales-2]